jgi:hypothetical protein
LREYFAYWKQIKGLKVYYWVRRGDGSDFSATTDFLPFPFTKEIELINENCSTPAN